MRPIWTSLLLLLCGCTVPDVRPGGDSDTAAPWQGLYLGTFDSALTADPGDDLNHNPCDPRNEASCDTHQAPLENILLEVAPDAQGRVSVTFYRDAGQRAAGRPLDLLGEGCGTRIGTAESIGGNPDGPGQVATFPLTADNRLCLGKLRPTSRHSLRLELIPGGGGSSDQARVLIDRRVEDTNYLYVVEDGVRRRVRIDLDNTVEDGDPGRYRVCIENDLGEYERCVLTDREFRSFALPIPVPGGAAVNYTWWHELSPRLRSTTGRYRVLRYVGRFERVVSR